MKHLNQSFRHFVGIIAIIVITIGTYLQITKLDPGTLEKLYKTLLTIYVGIYKWVWSCLLVATMLSESICMTGIFQQAGLFDKMAPSEKEKKDFKDSGLSKEINTKFWMRLSLLCSSGVILLSIIPLFLKEKVPELPDFTSMRLMLVILVSLNMIALIIASLTTKKNQN